jgi:hypothetical protein
MTEATETTKWEPIEVARGCCTERLRVDGGHLYHHIVQAGNQITSSMSFVPEIDLTRYQAHMRDAYKKGYLDGHADSKQGINAISE